MFVSYIKMYVFNLYLPITYFDLPAIHVSFSTDFYAIV